jgi:hypothetical protein
MTHPVLSRFASASASSKMIDESAFTAPAAQGPDADYDFLTILNTAAEYRTESGISHFHSLSNWGDGHNSAAHAGSSCVHLAYPQNIAKAVSEMAAGADLFHYIVPIEFKRQNATLLAFPSTDHFNHSDTTRAASILAHLIGVKGVIPNSYLSTFFWTFQKHAIVTQAGSTLMNNEIIEDNHGQFVQIKDYLL